MSAAKFTLSELIAIQELSVKLWGKAKRWRMHSPYFGLALNQLCARYEELAEELLAVAFQPLNEEEKREFEIIQP
jgi:hypothetical protein